MTRGEDGAEDHGTNVSHDWPVPEESGWHVPEPLVLSNPETESARPRDPSIRDVLDKLAEMETKLSRIEQQIDNGLCHYGTYD